MGLKELYFSIEDKYYAFIESLASHGLNFKPLVEAIESRGIPSLPLFALIFVLLFGTIAFVLLSPGLASNQLVVQVKASDGSAIDGATVSLSGDTYSASQQTAAGKAIFTNVPPGEQLSVRISKDGFQDKNLQLVAGQPVEVVLQAKQASSVTVVVKGPDAAGVSGAEILYQFGGDSQTVTTDARGSAKLEVPIGAEVSLAINAPGYLPYSGTIKPNRIGFTQTITLTRSVSALPNRNSLVPASRQVPTPDDADSTCDARTTCLADQVNVQVAVTNSNHQPLEGAAVTLYLQTDNSVLGEGLTNAAGEVVLSEQTAGLVAYAVVEADGYVRKTTDAVTLASGTRIVTSLTAASDANVANLSVSFTDGNRAVTAQYYVLDSTSHAVLFDSSKARSRSANITLEVGQSVYVSAYSSQYVRYASDVVTLVQGANHLEGALVKKTADNSYALKVNLVDFYGRAVTQQANVSVSLASEDGAIKARLMPVEMSNLAGLATVQNLPPQKIVVQATLEGFQSEQVVVDPTDPAFGQNTTLQLVPIPTLFSAIATTYGGAQLNNVTYRVFYVDSESNTDIELPICTTHTTAGVCNSSVISGVMFKLVTSAAGYYDTVQTFSAVPGTPLNLNVKLVSSTSSDVLTEDRVAISKVDSRGTLTPLDSQSTLEAGSIYQADLGVLIKPNSAKTGLYFRVGKLGSDSALTDSGAVIKSIPLDDRFSAGEMDRVTLTGATSYAATSCGSNVAQDAAGIFKWLNYEIPQSAYASLVGSDAASVVNLKVRFVVTSTTARNVTLFYRAYSALPGDNNAQAYERAPVDPVLRTQRELPERRECGAVAFNKTIGVVTDASRVVQCTNNACLTVSFLQGSKTGGASFQAVPAVLPEQTLPNPLTVSYSIVDFVPNLEDGTRLEFKPDRNFLAVLKKESQDEPTGDFSVDVTQNKFTKLVKNGDLFTSTIKANPLNDPKAEFPIELKYGDKATLSTTINLLGLPKPEVSLGALPAYYEMRYVESSASNPAPSFQLFDNLGHEQTMAKLFVDPVMPADAVLLLFNLSAIPSCQQVVTNLLDPTGCFTVSTNVQKDLALPEEYKAYGSNLAVVKYDASSTNCKRFSADPNVMKTAQAFLHVVQVCSSANMNLTLQVTARSALTQNGGEPEPSDGKDIQFKPEYSSFFMQEAAWHEPGVPDGLADESFIAAFINNRQYSADGYTPLYEGSADFPLTDPVGNWFRVPVYGVRTVSFTAGDRDQFLSRVLASNSRGMPPTLQLYDLDAGKQRRDNPPASMQSTYQTSMAIINNTAYRRKQTCQDAKPCPFGKFPLSAFRPAVPARYYLGGDMWTGRAGDGKVDFKFSGVNVQDVCTARNEEGLYGYYWEWNERESDGASVRSKNAKPLELTELDYFSTGCSTKQTLCGKLSFSGGQCLNNCGDGWYYGAYEGMKAPLCDGETEFKVAGIYPETSRGEVWGETLKQAATGLTECLVAETAAAWAGCEAGGAVGGPVGAYIGARGTAIAAGYGMSRLNDKLLAGWEQDVPALPKFFRGWQTACGYAGIGLQAYEVYTMWNQLNGLSEFKCPGIAEAWKVCTCQNPVPGGSTDNWNAAGCWISRAAQSSLKSPNFEENRRIASADYEDIQEKQKKIDASNAALDKKLKEYSGGSGIETFDVVEVDGSTSIVAKSNGELLRLEDAKLAEVKALNEKSIAAGAEFTSAQAQLCQSYNVPLGSSCTQFLGVKNENLEKLADYNDYFNGLCSYPFVIMGSQRLLGNLIYSLPQRVHLQILNSGKKSDSFIENAGGWVTDESSDAVDCTNSELFPSISNQKDYVWLDWDMSSLRGYEGDVRACMDYNAVKLYVPDSPEQVDGFDPIDERGIGDSDSGRTPKSSTFYITSRGN